MERAALRSATSATNALPYLRASIWGGGKCPCFAANRFLPLLCRQQVSVGQTMFFCLSRLEDRQCKAGRQNGPAMQMAKCMADMPRADWS